jgi:hypothetical protein
MVSSRTPHIAKQFAHDLISLDVEVSKQRIRLGIDLTMASKLLSCSLACSTQVVSEHETRCLNVKLLIFPGPAQ